MSTTHNNMSTQSTLYRYVLKFRKQFTSGTLKGIKIHESLPFVSRHRAMVWLKDVEAKSDAGRLNYDILDYQIGKL